MRELREIAGGIILVAMLYAGDTIGSAVLVACEQRIPPAHQLFAAIALTSAAAFAAYAFERRRRARGLHAWNWYSYAVGSIALGSFGAALHADAVRNAAQYLFNAMFFVIATPVLRRWWRNAWHCFRRDRATL